MCIIDLPLSTRCLYPIRNERLIVVRTISGEAVKVPQYEQLHTFLKSQDEVEILIEKPNGLLVEFLLQHGWCVKVITPSVSASHRPRRSKTDTGDAFLLANLLRMNDPDCHLIHQDSALVQELRQVVDAHINLQREKQRLILQQRYVLKQYYPAIFDICGKLGNKLTLDFLAAYPTPQDAKSASIDELRLFFKSQVYRYMDRVPHKYQQLQKASVEAQAQTGFVMRMLSLVRVLKVMVQEVKALQKSVIQTTSRCRLVASIPRVGQAQHC